MVDLIDAIVKGIDLHSFFYSKYYGAVKYRPLSNLELADCMDKAVAGQGREVKETIQYMQLYGKLPDVPREMVSVVAAAYDKMCSWIVYHAVKDFQKENWQHEHDNIPLGIALLQSNDNYLEVSQMAKEVLSFTIIPREEMEAFISDETGELLAKALWKLNYPLTDKAWKITPLQMTFELVSRGERKKAADLQALRAMMPNPMAVASPEEAALIEKCEEIRKRIKR